jgi:large conductance mechanosensitive channel
MVIKFIEEFKAFIMKGNVIDLAVAVIIGGAFNKVISSLVNDIIMPPIGLILGGVNFKDLKYVIQEAAGDTAEVAILYGSFIQNIIDFILVGFAIFVAIKFYTHLESLRKKPAVEAAPAEPSVEVKLLTEIRDLLKK